MQSVRILAAATMMATVSACGGLHVDDLFTDTPFIDAGTSGGVNVTASATTSSTTTTASSSGTGGAGGTMWDPPTSSGTGGGGTGGSLCTPDDTNATHTAACQELAPCDGGKPQIMICPGYGTNMPGCTMITAWGVQWIQCCCD